MTNISYTVWHKTLGDPYLEQFGGQNFGICQNINRNDFIC